MLPCGLLFHSFGTHLTSPISFIDRSFLNYGKCFHIDKRGTFNIASKSVTQWLNTMRSHVQIPIETKTVVDFLPFVLGLVDKVTQLLRTCVCKLIGIPQLSKKIFKSISSQVLTEVYILPMYSYTILPPQHYARIRCPPYFLLVECTIS